MATTTLQSGFVELEDVSGNLITLTNGSVAVRSSSNLPITPTLSYELVPKKYVDDIETAIESTISGIDTRLAAAETELGSIVIPDEIQALSNSISTLTSDLATANTELTSLEGRIATAEAELAQGDLQTIVTNISTLQTTTSSTSTSLTTLTGRVSTAEGDIDSIEARLDTLETNTGGVDLTGVTSRLDGHDTDIAALETDVSALTTRVGSTETTNSTQDGRLSTLETASTSQASRITVLEGVDVGYGNRLNSAETSISSLTSRATALETTTGQHSTRLTSAETSITDHGSRLTTAEGTLSTVNTRQAEFSDFDIDKVQKTIALSGYNITIAELTLEGQAITQANGDGAYLTPAGGTTGQVLAKKTATDGDFEYVTLTKSLVGLGNVDNTSDANKQVSTATSTALALKSDIASPTFTGTVTAPNLSLSSISSATKTDVLYYDASTKAVSYGAAPSGGGGGTSQTINTITPSSTFFIGPSAIQSGTNYGSSTLGAGFYQVHCNGWLTPSSGVVTIDTTTAWGYNASNRNWAGTFEIVGRSLGSNKTAMLCGNASYRGGQSAVSYTLYSSWNNGATTWSISNQGGTGNLRVSCDTDMYVTYSFRGAI